MSYETATPQVAVYILIEREDKYLFVKRANTKWRNDWYGLISGKVEKGESSRKAALREAKEEAGVDVAETYLKHILTMHRNEDGGTWIDLVFEAEKYEGEPYNAEPESHSEAIWLDPNSIPDNVIPSTRFMLEAIWAGKTYIEYGW
ncbi:MAG: NUDIX domain-containing protein [Candidatus Saccharimonadales bacterium]